MPTSTPTRWRRHDVDVLQYHLPDLFAASLFVDCHWDKSKFDELARHTFTYVTAGSVLPADGKGSEHMYSFDYAYRLTPVLQWMFRQSKK